MTKHCSIAMAALCLACTAAFSATIVVPNANANTAGNFNVGGATTPTPSIFQEVFASGQFKGPSEITQLSLREAPGTGGADFVWQTLNISLAYSANSPSSLSTTFANNVTSGNTLVFSGSNIIWTDSGCSGPGPCPFDININLATPFYYNPANGNLLMGIVTSDGSNPGGNNYLDGAAGSAVGLVYEDGSTSATTGTILPGGPIVQFTYTPVPEPATFLPLLVGLVAIFHRILPLLRTGRT